MRRVILLVLCSAALLAGGLAGPTTAQDKKKDVPKEPRVIVALPLGAAPGKATKVVLRGRLLDTATDVKVLDGKGTAKLGNKGQANVPDKNPEKVGDTQAEVTLTLADKLESGSVSLVVATPRGETKPHPILVETAVPVIAEKEPNEGFRNPQPLTLPTLVEGAVERQRDVDVFRIDGKAGQKVVAEVQAARHGSPLDAMLTLYTAAGHQLASADDFSDSRDARLEVTLPADGPYFLSLIDAHDVGSPVHVYRLLVK